MTALQVPEAFLPLWTGKAPGLERIEHYAFFGGRGGAKSHSIAEAVVGLSSQGKERVVCGRQFQNSVKDSSKELLETKIHKMGMGAFWRSTETELINVSTGSRITFIGMDRNPQSAKSLEGCTLFWGEEAAAFTPLSIEIIIPTVRAAGSRMVWGWNPVNRKDAIDAMFRCQHPPEFSYIRHVSWRDNPHFHLTRMPSEMRRSAKSNPKRHAHIWEGAYDENPDVAIFERWRIGAMDVPAKARPRFGMDFGFSNDPNAVIKSYLLEDQGIIYVAQEAYGRKIPNRKLRDLVDSISEIRNYHITADSSRPETIEQLQSDGFSIYGAKKGAGSVKNGLNFLAGYEIVIHPSCENIIAEIRAYLWATDPEGKPLPLPAPKQADHGIDALRYAHEDDANQADSEDGGFEYL